MNDGDVEGFKARVIHRALIPNVSEYPSSASTANFNWSFSRASTAGPFNRSALGRDNSSIRSNNARVSSTQDRFLPVVMGLEN